MSEEKSDRSRSPIRSIGELQTKVLRSRSPSPARSNSGLQPAADDAVRRGVIRRVIPAKRITGEKKERGSGASVQKHHHIHEFTLDGNAERYEIDSWVNFHTQDRLVPTHKITSNRVHDIIRQWTGETSLASTLANGLLAANNPIAEWNNCEIDAELLETPEDRRVVKHLLALKENSALREYDIDSKQGKLSAEANCVSALTLHAGKLSTSITIDWREVLEKGRLLLKECLMRGEAAP